MGSLLLYPFLPNCASKVLEAFNINPRKDGFKSLNTNDLPVGNTMSEVSMLFPRLDIEKELKELSELT